MCKTEVYSFSRFQSAGSKIFHFPSGLKLDFSLTYEYRWHDAFVVATFGHLKVKVRKIEET